MDEVALVHSPLGVAVNSITPPFCHRDKKRTGLIWYTGEVRGVSALLTTSVHIYAQIQTHTEVRLVQSRQHRFGIHRHLWAGTKGD